MRLKRVNAPAKDDAGKTSARRDPWRPLFSASVASTFVLGGVAAYSIATAPAELAASLAARGTGVVDPSVAPYMTPAILKQVPAGPGQVSRPVQMILTSSTVVTALAKDGIPQVAYSAYTRAASLLAIDKPSCHLPWELLAGIGRVESDNGQFGGAKLLSDGNGTKPIYGIPLDGRNGVALIRDTDGGKLDGDPNFDRAVGPMQFIPSSWAIYGVDGNGDGKKDPNNIFDAAQAAGDYLCAGGGNMTIPAQETAAVLSYNDADDYVRVVLSLAASYGQGNTPVLPTTAAPAGSSGGSGTAPVAPAAPASQKPASSSSPKASSPAKSPKASSPAKSPKASSPAKPAAPATSAKPAAPVTAVKPSPLPSVPPPPPGRTVGVGWASAMRSVVLQILTGTSAPSQSATPAQAATPAQPAAPTQPAIPSQAATPAQSATPSQPAASTKPAQPAATTTTSAPPAP